MMFMANQSRHRSATCSQHWPAR